MLFRLAWGEFFLIVSTEENMKRLLGSIFGLAMALISGNAFAAVDLTGVTYDTTTLETGAVVVIGFVVLVGSIVALINMFRRGRN